MPDPLPPRASLEWLKKTAKQKLRRLREGKSGAKLAEAQREVALSYGFSSWRALHAHVHLRDRDRPGEEEASAFLRAVGDGDIETVRMKLAAKPELVNAAGRHPYWGGRPQPLHVAVEMGRQDIFDLLLDAGADVDGCNEAYDRWSPLMLTVSGGRGEMRASLIARGATVGLVEALMMKDDRRVGDLLGDGIKPDAPNGGSLLAFARTPFAIDRLLELGAGADEKDRWGVTPVDAMSRLGAEGRELVRHLMIRGAAPAPEQFARLGDEQSLAILAESDGTILARDAVLLAAVEGRHHALVRWLLGRGADPNARSDDVSRRTALHAAAWGGDLEMVQILVTAGADPGARDAEHHETPLGWARTSIRVSRNPDCAEVAQYLSSLDGG